MPLAHSASRHGNSSHASLQPITAAVWTPGSLRPGRPAPSASSRFIGVLGMRRRRKKHRDKRVMRKGDQETTLLQSGPHFWAPAHFPLPLAPLPQLPCSLGLQQSPHPLLLQLPSRSDTPHTPPTHILLVTYCIAPFSLQSYMLRVGGHFCPRFLLYPNPTRGVKGLGLHLLG